MRFAITTFHTESQPHDNGEDLTASEAKFRLAAEPHCDLYLPYSPRKGPPCPDHTEWLQTHPNVSELGNHNPSWARTGFQSWKPLLLKIALGELKDKDTLLYHDVNIEKYPQYTQGCDQWRLLSNAILDDLGCDVFSPFGLPLKYDTKDFLTRKYNVDNEKMGLWNGIVILRKSKQSERFVDEWIGMCELENISPLPNPNPNEHLFWHSVDQSVMGVLGQIWKENGLLPTCWPKYHLENRVFSNSSLRTLT